jgi:hypothetical protein
LRPCLSITPDSTWKPKKGLIVAANRAKCRYGRRRVKMNKFGQILKVAGIIAAIVLAGVAVGWWGTHGVKPNTPITPATPATPAPVVTQADAKGAGLFPRHHPSPQTGSNASPSQPSGTPPDLLTNWEDRVDEILTGAEEEAVKARGLLEIFPALPEDGQVEVAHHLSNLVADEDYASLSQFLVNSTLPESVLDVFFADALNRPNSLKLPALLSVARDPQHPKAGEAKDVLGIFLEEDYGSDWTAWQAKLDQWLKDNPD